MRDFDEIDIGQGDSDIIFADLDHDGDGKINFEDFRSVLNMIFTYFYFRQKITLKVLTKKTRMLWLNNFEKLLGTLVTQ